MFYIRVRVRVRLRVRVIAWHSLRCRSRVCVGRGAEGAEAPPPKCVKGARVMGVGTLLANVTLLILSIMQFTQFICSHDHTD